MRRRLIPVLALLAAVPGVSTAQIAGGLRLEGVQTCAQLTAFTARNPGFDGAMLAAKREDLGGCAPPPRIAPRPAPAPRVRPRPPTPPIARAVPTPAPPAVRPAPRPVAPGITPRLNAPNPTPRLNATVSPTTGLNTGPAASVLTLPTALPTPPPTAVAALTYSAPAGCRWTTAGASPELECLNEDAVWRPVEDAGITVGTVDAAARGEALAMAGLGYFYDVQPPPIRNRAEAIRLYRAAADQGVAIAKYNLAVLYQSGVPGVLEPDPAEARRYFVEAADQGLAAAMRRLAEQAGTSAGAGSKGDWYLRAARAGDTPSMGKVAELYRAGDGGLARDPAAAVDWARQADAHGDPWGRYILGLCFETGDGELVEDPAEAWRLFRIAADAGIAPAMGKVGEYLYQGWGGVARDDREALIWLDRAARARDSRAQYYLAIFHLDGLAGLPRDPAAAAALMLTSAQAGDGRAMFRTGRNYEVGIGVSPDLYAARRWYRRAADAGDPDARVRLDVLGPS